MGRPKEQLGFAPDQPASVLAWMERISTAGDGWINLTPEVRDEEAVEFRQTTGLFSFLGGRQSSTVMCTWMPARPGRHEHEVTIGVLHPRGRAAAVRLREAGAPVPTGWRVSQDNTRRGLILKAPVSTTHREVLDWVIRATELLNVEPLTGLWRAEVFPPVTPDAT
jgi:hypothetical protein